ncbi:MAG: hypothetical protein R3Y32_06860 [Bacillota bacterium]
MNWKILAIVLIVVVVIVGAYSFGIGYFTEEESVDDGTAEVLESFDVSGSIQSDFWDSFSDWLWANLWWMCGAGLIVWGVTSYAKSRK